MVRQTKRFKKGLNKKVLSAILAASMIMTSSSFAFASTTDEAASENTAVSQDVNGVLTEDAEDLGDDVDSDTQGNTGNEISTLSIDPDSAVDAQDAVEDSEEHFEIVVHDEDLTYNGEAQEPDVEVYYHKETGEDGNWNSDNRVPLQESEYSVHYGGDTVNATASVDEGEKPYVEISFSGWYAGTAPVKKNFTIKQADITEADVKWEEVDSFVYDGKVHYPKVVSATVKVMQDGKEAELELTEDDYDIIDYNGVIAGTDGTMINATNSTTGQWQARLKGKGNFTGEIAQDDPDSKMFDINQADLGEAADRGDITVTVDPVVYDNELKYDAVKNNVQIVENATGKALDVSAYAIQVKDEDGKWTGTYTEQTLPQSAMSIGTHELKVYISNTRNYEKDSYIETTYEVVASSLATVVKDATVTGFEQNNEAEYTGKDFFPNDMETALLGTDLEYGLDYVITNGEEEWINAGEYTLNLEGRNEYAGQTATVTVKITPKALKSTKHTVEQGTHRSGNLGSVIVTIEDTIKDEDGKDKKVVLEEGKDYTFEVTKEATKTSKTGKVEITGIGNYTTADEEDGVIHDTFTLKDQLPLSDPSISVEVVGEFAYDGNTINVDYDDFKLVETDGTTTYELTNKDYSIKDITIGNNFAGTMPVTLVAVNEGRYFGERVVNVDVKGLSFEDTFDLSKIKDVSLDDEAQSYTELLKDFKVTYKTSGGTYTKVEKTIYGPDGKEIPVGTWADKITEPGTYTVKVESTEDKYVGSLETTFNVIGHDLKKAGAVVADIEDQVYTSEAITPAVTVKVGDKTLVAGEDYEVTYTDNVKGGEATAIITGINDYSGTLEKNFNITRAAQGITMTNPLQERDLGNGSRTSTSKVCTLKLATTMADEDTKYTYTTSDPSVATVNAGKITYQGVGECTITVSAAATDSCEAASLDIKVVVGKPGTPTFTPSVTKNTAKKAFVVTSSTVKGVDGWEVQYSIKDTFWKATTKDFPGTKTKLLRQTCKTVHSNMTYYIRVRGYQTVNGEKVYSDWSPVKTIVTK